MSVSERSCPVSHETWLTFYVIFWFVHKYLEQGQVFRVKTEEMLDPASVDLFYFALKKDTLITEIGEFIVRFGKNYARRFAESAGGRDRTDRPI